MVRTLPRLAGDEGRKQHERCRQRESGHWHSKYRRRPHDRGGRVVLRRVLPAANAIFLGPVMVRLGSLVLVPLFLRYWSPVSYGAYLALFPAAGSLGSLDIGMQWRPVNRPARAHAT